MTKEAREARAADRIAAEQQRHQEFSLALVTLKRLEPAVEAGVEEARTEWLEVATFLVDAFREQKELFPSDASKKFTGVRLQRTWTRKGVKEKDIEVQADEMASRLERTMSKWLWRFSAGGVRRADPSPSATADEEVEQVLAVDSYRGINFDEWLELIMKVRHQPCLGAGLLADLAHGFAVRLPSHQERRDRGGTRNAVPRPRRQRL